MGLLDDAIREHLDLKRRRGADAAEVSRLEQEALGPPQRGEFAGAAKPADAPEPADAVDPAETVEPEPEPEPNEPAAAAPEPPTEWLEDEPEPPAAPVADDPPAAYQAPSALPATEPEAERDDVLEETPDFLQETPEHDRLWFEQKPPRDFDLDR
jgi:hypothetical protein